MAAQTNSRTPRTAFGRNLRVELDRQDVSVRALARRMNPYDPEGMRRNIARWLSAEPSAVSPSPASLAAVAAALDVTLEQLEPDDDDEESDPMTDLLRGLRALVREVARTEATA